jgi:hypothetical protein
VLTALCAVLHAAAKACVDDIHKFCNVTWFAGLSPGSVLACLKEARTTLKPACQKEVFKLQLDAAEDYRCALSSNLQPWVSRGKAAAGSKPPLTFQHCECKDGRPAQ